MSGIVPSTPCPAYEWDEDQAYRELEELARMESEQAVALRKLLKESTESVPVTFEVDGEAVTITIHAILPYELRAKVIDLQQQMYQIEHETDPDVIAAFVNRSPVEMQRPMYEILALICTEAPFTNWETWAVIDQRTGRGPMVLSKLMEALNLKTANIGRFRGK